MFEVKLNDEVVKYSKRTVKNYFTVMFLSLYNKAKPILINSKITNILEFNTESFKIDIGNMNKVKEYSLTLKDKELKVMSNFLTCVSNITGKNFKIVKKGKKAINKIITDKI